VIRAVLDPGIYARAVLQPRGASGQLVTRFLRDSAFALVVSPAIADETMRVLAHPPLRKRVRGKVQPQEWFEDVLALADLVDDRLPPRVCHDPEDDKYLAAAVEGRANYLVTNDEHLLALREHDRVMIESAQAFLELLGPNGT
jgi:putative PIN family toxin of toxin-antitoxin system